MRGIPPCLLSLEWRLTLFDQSPPDAPRLRGAHYSPRSVVDFVVGRLVGDLLRQRRWSDQGQGQEVLPRVCDPACGAGVFLASALDSLARWLSRRIGPDPAPGWLAGRLERCLFGVDVDREAVRSTRANLLQSAVRWDPACEDLDFAANIVVGNSLVTPRDGDSAAIETTTAAETADWDPVSFRERFGGGDEPGRFDLVVSNPPYVDSGEMTRSAPDLRRYLAQRYETASGNWDLFCPFVERAAQLLSADGRVGLIVPNKLLSAAYARKTRRLLAAMDLVLLRDYSRVRLFDAAVYPLVLMARRTPRPRRRRTLRLEVVAGTLDACRIETHHTVDSAEAGRTAEVGWSSLFVLPAVSPIAIAVSGASAAGPQLREMGEVARIVGAASVADAYTLGPLVRECDHDHDHGYDHGTGCHRLINTGTIDPHQLLWGRRRLRYLGATYERPCVDAAALEAALPRRAAQARAPKIVVAGLARRLECVFDPGGRLAGKSTSLVLAPDNTTDDTHAAVDQMLLLGLLNSAAASAMFRLQWSGLALSGDYLRIGPPQLRALQIPDPAEIPLPVRRLIRDATSDLRQLDAEGVSPTDDRWKAHQARIDTATWPLFGLDP
jgi:Eco57I restriction-modification methylase